MQLLLLWSAILTGPCLGFLMLALSLARRFFPDAHILFEVTEPMLVIAAGIVALALAGVMVQLI
jgi:hypothetical protein